MEDKIDTDAIKKKILNLLESHNINPSTSFNTKDRGDIYKIQTKEALLKITIGKSWIGYELLVGKEVVGKKIDVSLDTDNYPLGGANKKITMNIASAIFQCAEALLERRVYVGRIDGKPALAVPNAHKKYELTYFGRFISQREEIAEEKLKNIASLRPLE